MLLEAGEALRCSTEALRLFAVAASYGQACNLYTWGGPATLHFKIQCKLWIYNVFKACDCSDGLWVCASSQGPVSCAGEEVAGWEPAVYFIWGCAASGDGPNQGSARAADPGHSNGRMPWRTAERPSQVRLHFYDVTIVANNIQMYKQLHIIYKKKNVCYY